MEIAGDRRPLAVRTSVVLKTEGHPSAGVGAQRRVRVFQRRLNHSGVVPLQGPLSQREPFQAGSVTADVLACQLHEEVVCLELLPLAYSLRGNNVS